MPFEAAICPRCGANIQVPADSEQARCMYCGSSLIVKDAVQKLKLELSGSVLVDSNIESVIKSAEGFLLLEKWQEAMMLYTRITEQNSMDYRGWWGLFLVKTHNMKLYNTMDSTVDISDAASAIKTAPDNHKAVLTRDYNNYYKYYPKNCRLTLDREKQITGLAIVVNININDKKMLSFNWGCPPSTLDLPEGTYKIDIVDNFFHSKTTVIFEMHNDSYICFKPGSFKMKARVEGATVISME